MREKIVHRDKLIQSIYMYIYMIFVFLVNFVRRKLIKIFSVSGIEMTLSVGQTGMFYN